MAGEFSMLQKAITRATYYRIANSPDFYWIRKKYQLCYALKPSWRLQLRHPVTDSERSSSRGNEQ
jgi:hypothetical protein